MVCGVSALQRTVRLLGRSVERLNELDDLLRAIEHQFGITTHSGIAIHVRPDVDGRMLDHSSASEAPPKKKIVLASAIPNRDERQSPAEVLRERAAAEGWDVDVRGVYDLGDVLDEIGLFARLERPETWSPEARQVAARALYDESRAAFSVPVGWWNLGRLASVLLLQMSPGDASLRYELEFARDVSLRHLGYGVLIAWPSDEWLRAQPAEERLEVLAHAVQSAADADLGEVIDRVNNARAWLPAEGNAASAKLLGAIGRAEAAVGDYVRAAASLRQALDVWTSLGKLTSEGSFAFCELCRVLGIEKRLSDIEALKLTHWDELMKSDPISAAYVQLALGRAFVQAGSVESGSSHLADSAAEWRFSPAHVNAARLRWLHRASLARGDAGHVLASLEQVGFEEQLHLARLDDALHRGVDHIQHLGALIDLPVEGEEAFRTLQRVAPQLPPQARLHSREAARRLADEYRY